MWSPRIGGLLSVVVLTVVACSSEEQAFSGGGGWPEISDSSDTRIVQADEATCSECIRFDTVAILGDQEGEGYLVQSQWVARDQGGRFWVLQPGGAKLFDSGGLFLQQVGVEGQGPMEFRSPNSIFVDRLGRVHIFDTGNSRESIVSSDLTLVEERRTPGLVMNAAELPSPHSYVASMHTGAMEPTTLPLHVVDSGGVSVSFGDPEPRGSATVLRRLAVDQRGWIYSVSPDEYYIQVWNVLGRRLAGFRREGVLPPGDNQGLQRGMVLALQIDGDRLWVLTWIARGGASAPAPTSVEGFKSSVEVIDIPAARVVARSEFDELFGGFLDDGLVFGPTSTAIGEPQIGVWRLQLVER